MEDWQLIGGGGAWQLIGLGGEWEIIGGVPTNQKLAFDSPFAPAFNEADDPDLEDIDRLS